jgi:ATP-binding cassette subfamily B protein/subfamily B ATP-binding cassette protein MsbA
LSKPFTELIGVGMIAITICAGAYLVVGKQTHIFGIQICDQPLAISSLLIFFGFLVGASDPLRKLSGVFTTIYGGVMAAESIYHILDHMVDVVEPASPKKVEGTHHVLDIQNVSFEYQSGSPVLHDISLNIPFGKTIAIVGANGSGKSTLIQLLCRFYDPTQGSIRLDGIDYRDQRVEDIRQRIALVSQHTELFNRTVYENILYGNPTCSEEEVIAAAKLAHAHDFISNVLSEGYQTIVGQGGQRLSGGQRQRVGLARAILRKPEILILDESTSQIDMQSEIQIRQSLAELKGSCTIIIITHRVALLELADEIHEINNGHISRIDASQVMAA